MAPSFLLFNTIIRVKISMFSPLLFFRLAIITMQLTSAILTARPFIETTEFPAQVPDFPEGPIMVNMFSFKPDDVPKTPWSATFRHLGMSVANRVAMDPGPPQTHIPYYSFYKNAQSFQKKYTQKGNQIKQLAEKVLELVKTLDYSPAVQNIWLSKKSELVQECQTLAYQALLEPKKLQDLERYWAIGIWVALEKGKKEDIHSEIEIPGDFNKQVYLETLVTLHHSPAITKAFDHWVNQKSITPRSFGGGLEESLKRAALIGEHEDERTGQPPYPIAKLVSEYLTSPELPQEIDQISRLLGQYREIFKNIEVQSWEGQYAIAIFKHIQNFQSSRTINESLHRALHEEPFWVDFHTFIAKDDIVQYSKKLKRFLSSAKLKSNTELNLYSILKDPLQVHINLHDAIKQLLLKLNTISTERLEYAYRLIIAHAFLRPTLEREILSQDSWDIVFGLQRAWALVYPGLELPHVGVMDYRYSILIKYPHLLAHANWDVFIDDARSVSREFSQRSNRSSLWDKPQRPYDISTYTEAYYHKIMTTMKGSEENRVLYTMGLEMLMHLNSLPNGQEFLLKMLKEDGFKAWVDDAIRAVRSHNQYNWNFWPSLFDPPRENLKLKKFVDALSNILLFQMQQESDHAIFNRWKTDWPTRPIARMKIGRRVYNFSPENWQATWTPLD
ncbi:uncharacterized protein MELLADRAFT_60319 [Melampsora larici-populina 98AG31]|uniref:Uncharacterized protein n=1 Tax=Melampsora larici-populina (strain 98AG31 / pathotype 3-4-7) TaxID=747676 RepID=F4RAW7_MELLP|nr:uncharacterized protein MELLADRAFT_60319 [Melampsora larici-populina 98AG31]EGG10547.1 hypothetical protein MELLADRAFT_60319 [Melampsora larici-populina 98AG31]